METTTRFADNALIEGFFVPLPNVGRSIQLDSGRWVTLALCDDWDQAKFRIPCQADLYQMAVNVRITGRTLRRRHDDHYVRVCIEWVGDGEPSVFSGAWMRSNHFWAD